VPQQQSNTRPIDRVLSRLEGVRCSGAGWMAKCPHHGDRQASLSLKEADDGKVLLHCFAGCANADVVMRLGLSPVDLFPAGSRGRLHARVWLGSIAMNGAGRPALGDEQVAALLAELARLAKVRNTLGQAVGDALKTVAAAVGVSPARLAEAVRGALATEEPA
jgi:hypothetical protein